MSTNKKILQRLVHKWQPILRLQDWDLTLQLVRTKWRKSGDVKIDLEDRKAILLISANPRCENLEELVIHELLHIKLYAIDQMIESLLTILYGRKMGQKKEFAYEQFMTLLESTVEDLTKGYLAACGSRQKLSINRLKQQVRCEIGKLSSLTSMPVT